MVLWKFCTEIQSAYSIYFRFASEMLLFSPSRMLFKVREQSHSYGLCSLIKRLERETVIDHVTVTHMSLMTIYTNLNFSSLVSSEIRTSSH